MSEPDRVWVPDRDWRVLATGQFKPCRCGRCRQPAVAELFRKGRKRSGWWAYCPEHLYGRQIVTVVMVSVHPESDSAKRGYFEWNGAT